MYKPLEVMFDSSNRLIKLVNDMLNIAKLESRKMEFENSTIHLQTFLAEIKYEYDNIAERAGLDFLFETDESIAITTDPNLLKQVLVNLI